MTTNMDKLKEVVFYKCIISVPYIIKNIWHCCGPTKS